MAPNHHVMMKKAEATQVLRAGVGGVMLNDNVVRALLGSMWDSSLAISD